MKIAIVHHPKIEVETSHVKVLLEQLDNVEDATCNEILLRGTLDYIHKRKDLIIKCITKLRYGGQLIVIGNDALSIGHLIARGDTIDDDKLISMIYEGRQSISSSFSMSEILAQAGLTVSNVNFSNYEYIITGTREKPDV